MCEARVSLAAHCEVLSDGTVCTDRPAGTICRILLLFPSLSTTGVLSTPPQRGAVHIDGAVRTRHLRVRRPHSTGGFPPAGNKSFVGDCSSAGGPLLLLPTCALRGDFGSRVPRASHLGPTSGPEVTGETLWGLPR